MPYKSQWLVEGRVTISHFWGVVTLDELRAANDRKVAFLEASPHPRVHILVDMTALVEIPVSYAQLRETLTMLQHPRLDRVVLYGDLSAFIKFVAGVVLRLIGVPMRIVPTYPEATAYLLEHDPDLAGLLPEAPPDGDEAQDR